MTDPATSTVPTREVTLAVGGMTCASCAARVERNLNRMPGVEATVNYATATAHVRYPEGLAPDALVGTVESTGYSADLPPEDARAGESAEPAYDGAVRLVVSALLTIPVVLLAMVRPWQFDGWQWVSLALATPVVVWGAWPFHRAAAVNARHGVATMDTLISLGVLAAYGWSLFALVLGDAGEIGMQMDVSWVPGRSGESTEIYLEVATGVTTLILLGRYLEAVAGRRSGSALRALLELGAKDVAVLRDSADAEVALSRRESRSRHSTSTTASWSDLARRSPPTASSSRGAAASTSRCSPASRCPSRSGRATRWPAERSTPRADSWCALSGSDATPRSRSSPGWSSRLRPARPTCSGSPTGSRRCSSRS